MATVIEKKRKTVEEVITKEVPDGVVVHLTQEEAQVVRTLTGNVGGSGPNRKASERVYWALHPHTEQRLRDLRQPVITFCGE